MRIKKLTLYTNALDSQKSFYTKVLGAPILEESDKHISVSCGWTELTFRQSESQHLYHYCFLIPVDALHSAKEWLEEKINLLTTDGHTIHCNESWNSESLYFYDGGGNIAELIVRHDLEYMLDDYFDYHSIICINEIGAPSSSITLLHNQLKSLIGTEPWKGNLSRFGTHGDQEGMFLLVNNTIKRTWYPTEIFPESTPFDCVIEVANDNYPLTFDGNAFLRK